MLQSYYSQLLASADRQDIDLAAACRRAGVASTTLLRWRSGKTSPRENEARRVMEAIEELADDRGSTDRAA